METKTEAAYKDFNARWDGTADHADRLLAEFEGWEVLDGATEVYENSNEEGAVWPDLSPEAEEAAQVLNALRDLGFEN